MLSTLPYERLLAKALRASPSSVFWLVTVLSAPPAWNSAERAASSSASIAGATLPLPSQEVVLRAWLSEAPSKPSRHLS